MSIPKATSLILILFLITSCAGVSYKKALKSLKNTTSCCTSFRELRYDQLQSGKPISFKLDENSDAFAFPTGKSYFKGFRLPDKEIPYQIYIKSFAMGETIDKAHIFYPQIMILDKDFKVIKQNTPEDFAIKKAGLRETASVSWRASMVKIEGYMLIDRPDARYFIIYTTDELLEKKSPYSTWRVMPFIFPGIVGALPTYKETIEIPHSPIGWIYLETID